MSEMWVKIANDGQDINDNNDNDTKDNSNDGDGGAEGTNCAQGAIAASEDNGNVSTKLIEHKNLIATQILISLINAMMIKNIKEHYYVIMNKLQRIIAIIIIINQKKL